MTSWHVLDLFSGIGGFSLGLERAGMRTVAFCEIDPFCRAVLRKHWPDVPICKDIKAMEAYKTAEGAGNGFVRERSFDWASCGAFQGKPPINVGRSKAAHDYAPQAIGASSAIANSNPQETCGYIEGVS